MEIKINTKSKLITITQNCNAKDLFDFLQKTLGDEMKDYQIVSDVQTISFDYPRPTFYGNEPAVAGLVASNYGYINH